jgi:hypothetical protein
MSVIDSILNQSIQFLLQKDTAAKQAELIDAQKALVLAQIASTEKETLLTEAQITKINREIEILDQQELLIEAQVLLTTAQSAKTDIESEVLLVEKTKLTQEVALVTATTAETNKKIEVLQAQLLNIPKEGLLIDKQVDKAESEILMLDQRTKTEKAQILDTVDGVAVAGGLSKQKDLYLAQTNGFARDAEQKLAKMLVDTWTIRRSTFDGTVFDSVNKLSDANIGAVLSKAMTSIGVTPV